MAVAFLNKGVPVRGATSPTGDAFSVTASGSNRCAFACIAYDIAAGMSVTGVTYGGQAMTACGPASHNSTSHDYAEVWYLVNPPTGSNTLAITVSGTITDIYRNLVSFTGVNQTTPVRPGTYFNHTNAQVFDGSSLYSLAVSSNANDLTLTCLNGGGLSLSGTNQTLDGLSNAGVESFGSDHATTAAASVTHTWTAGAPSSNMAILGFSINGDPSSVTYYLNNPVQGGSNAGLLTTTAPAASTSTTGWTVGTTAVNQYSRQTYNSEIATTGFTSTAQPSGTLVNLGEDCYRSTATTGTFSAGTWYSSISCIAVSSGGIQQARGRFRIWKSSNADGTSATELTQGTMIGSQITELSTTVAQTSSASTAMGAVTLTNEYLFYQIALETL